MEVDFCSMERRSIVGVFKEDFGAVEMNIDIKIVTQSVLGGR